jgi:hypothetical protein
LLLAAAEELKRRGLRPALVMNDQGEDLVDTRYAGLHQLETREVTGGCFCCRFSSLLESMDALKSQSPDVILAEPVGSCTDLAATILQPLREYAESYRVAPFTVLVDPAMASTMLRDDADPHLRFLFTKQLQEADIVCLTKADTYAGPTSIDGNRALRISAKTGAGVGEWLDEMTSGTLSVGTRLLEIDYQQYADAEAALAWLNLQTRVELKTPTAPSEFLGSFLQELAAGFNAKGISIVHLKAIAQSQSGFAKAAVCFNGRQPVVEGMLDAAPSSSHELLLNLRAVGNAAEVRSIVEAHVNWAGETPSAVRIACFHPAPPKPERRVTQIL